MTSGQLDSIDQRVASFVADAETVLRRLGVDPQVGLDEARVAALRDEHGLNQLAEAPPVPVWRKLLAQFKDLVIWILILAAIVSGVLGEWVDTIAIVAIVLLNGVIGFLQEERAERGAGRAAEALIAHGQSVAGWRVVFDPGEGHCSRRRSGD